MGVRGAVREKIEREQSHTQKKKEKKTKMMLKKKKLIGRKKCSKEGG